MWIGSKKKSKVHFLRDVNFCWDPGIFTVLGTKFCTDTEHINVIHHDNTLLKIKIILKVWKRRQLTPLGKITVINTSIVKNNISVYQLTGPTRHISARPGSRAILICMGR